MLGAFTLAACTSAKETPRTSEPRRAIRASDCGACHVDDYQQWQTSVKAHTGENPLFLAFYDLARRDLGEAGAKTCAPCHLPALPSLREQSPAIDCEVCHRVSDVVEQEGRFTHVYVEGALVTGPPGFPECRHKYWGREVFTRSEFCAPCHAGAHESPSLAGVSSFPSWRASWHAKQGVTCQKCHMEEQAGRGASHAFVGGGNDIWLREAIELNLKGEAGNWQIAMRNTATPHNIPGEAADLRELVVQVIWLGADGRTLAVEEKSRLGALYSDDRGRAVPYWRAAKAERLLLAGGQAVTAALGPAPEGATAARVEVIYHRVSVRLAWLFGGRMPAPTQPSVAVSRTFDLGSGKPMAETEIPESKDWE